MLSIGLGSRFDLQLTWVCPVATANCEFSSANAGALHVVNGCAGFLAGQWQSFSLGLPRSRIYHDAAVGRSVMKAPICHYYSTFEQGFRVS